MLESCRWSLLCSLVWTGLCMEVLPFRFHLQHDSKSMQSFSFSIFREFALINIGGGPYCKTKKKKKTAFKSTKTKNKKKKDYFSQIINTWVFRGKKRNVNHKTKTQDLRNFYTSKGFFFQEFQPLNRKKDVRNNNSHEKYIYLGMSFSSKMLNLILFLNLNKYANQFYLINLKCFQIKNLFRNFCSK